MVFPLSNINLSDRNGEHFTCAAATGCLRLARPLAGRQLAVLLLVALLMSGTVVTCICSSVGLSEYHLLVNFGDTCPTGLQMS